MMSLIHAEYRMLAYALVAAAMVGFGGSLGYGLRDMAADTEVANIERDHAATMRAISDAAAKAAKDAIKKEQDLVGQIAALDKIRTEENERAGIEIDRLRDDISSGVYRMSVLTKSSPSCAGLSKGSASASLDNGSPRAELDPAHAERIIAIPAEGDKAIRQLIGCQQYVKILTGQK